MDWGFGGEQARQCPFFMVFIVASRKGQGDHKYKKHVIGIISKSGKLSKEHMTGYWGGQGIG